MVSYEYLSCSVNPTPHVADWVRVQEGGVDVALYVFAAHKGIATWSDDGTPAMAATPFRERVHVLKAVPRVDAPLVVAASYGGELSVWRPHYTGTQWTWQSTGSVPDAHAASITALGVVRDPASLAHDSQVLVTGSTDNTLKVWALSGDDTLAEPSQVLDLDGKYPLDIALAHVPGTPCTLMAVAMTDRRVFLYARTKDRPFVRQLALEGHEDWVRALDFAIAPNPYRPDTFDMHLASASQDHHIRLWRIQAELHVPEPSSVLEDAFEAMAREIVPNNDHGISTKKEWLSLGPGMPRWSVSLDALLVGHEGWVTGLRWYPASRADGQHAVLLSSSVDNSMIVWSPQAPGTTSWPLLADEATSQALWLPVHRLGDVGSLAGGFLHALWHPASSHGHQAVLTYDRQGATHRWVQDATTLRWLPRATVSGHAGAVRGIAWEPYGDYLLSTGADRTTRLHGTYVATEEEDVSVRRWYEMARPQTHGYDLHAVAWLDRATFLSAADEKVLRVLGAPRSFVQNALATHMLQTHVRTADVLVIDADAAALRAPARLDTAVARVLDTQPAVFALLVFCADAASLPVFERFLQHVYTTAWNAAVAHDQWQTEITVFLLPGTSSTPAGHASVRAWTNEWDDPIRALWVVDPQEDAAYACDPAALALISPRPPTSVPIDAVTGPADDINRAQRPPAVLGTATVALGGTFDHLHIGHKLLLSIASLCAHERLIVGVTSSELLTKKKHRALVETNAVRLQAVRRFLRMFRAAWGPLALDIVPIHDVCGPAGTDPDLGLLVVTTETAQGADIIAEKRKENGVAATDVYIVALVDTPEAEKVGSTAIRGRLAAHPGAPVLDTDLGRALKQGASSAGVPALGLSNRAVVDEEEGALLDTPPNPEQLQSQTLWPEMEKLYGHGYELLSVAVDRASKTIASTCKATTPAHAVVRVFEGAQRYRPVLEALQGHTLSITHVRFSGDGQYLLTASRDRSWRLFRREGAVYVPWAGERAHARIVWDCAWGGADAPTVFATASRDKTVKVWRVTDDAQRYTLLATLPVDRPAMCVAFGPGACLAVGLENGDVGIYTPDAAHTSWARTFVLPQHHTGAVHQLEFRPRGQWMDAYKHTPYQLLSAGDDGCVRLVSWIPSGHTSC